MRILLFIFNVVLIIVVLTDLHSGTDNIFSSCDTEQSLLANNNIVLKWIQTTVFNSKCASCHGGIAPRGALDLSEDKSYQNLVNVIATSSSLKPVVPGEIKKGTTAS